LVCAYIDSKHVRSDMMNMTRQDAWTEVEDLILAETAIRSIRQGKTQLEAFRDVATGLSRTAAACGFRWNATIRTQHQKAIEKAKEETTRTAKDLRERRRSPADPEKDTLGAASRSGERMKASIFEEIDGKLANSHRLEEESKQLRKKVERYEHSWEEIGN